MAGVGARVATALGPGSLWWDELDTALNVTQRDWGELLDPLGKQQIAPIGFIAAEKAGTSLLSGDLGLRLFPLLFSILSLFLFWRVASRYLAGVSLLAGVTLFAASPAMVWYARKAKQYAGDVSATLVLLWLAQKSREDGLEPRQVWLAGMAGGVAITVSHPAVLVASALLILLASERLWEKRSLKPLLGLIVGWGIGIAVQFWTIARLTPDNTRDFMQSAWSFAFMPAPTQSASAALWLPRQVVDFMGFLVGLLEVDSAWEAAFISAYCVLAVLGVIHLIRARGWDNALLFVPLVAAILASVVRILPLSGRLMIYTSPTVLIACLAGVDEIRARLPSRLAAGAQGVAMALAIVPALFLPVLIPALNGQDDTRPVLQEVRQRWQEGDILYVYYGGTKAMKFYGEPMGMTHWIEGSRFGGDQREYLRDLDKLRGQRRAWFFHAHAIGCISTVMHSYLETIGTEIDVVHDSHGNRGMHRSEARLYDLSDPERLARSSAEAHPLLKQGDPRCRDPKTPIGNRIKLQLRGLFRALTG